jgi:hypothetical protein
VHDRERRRRAADLFNLVWRLLEKPDRTVEDDELMVHAAHASRFYWGESGTAVNWARGDWQLSRVYATLGRAEPALHHAHRCLDRCLAHADELEPFDLPFAYEALARAYAVAGDAAEGRRYLALAREGAEQIEDADDRELLLGDLEFDPADPSPAPSRVRS